MNSDYMIDGVIASIIIGTCMSASLGAYISKSVKEKNIEATNRRITISRHKNDNKITDRSVSTKSTVNKKLIIKDKDIKLLKQVNDINKQTLQHREIQDMLKKDSRLMEAFQQNTVLHRKLHRRLSVIQLV